MTRIAKCNEVCRIVVGSDVSSSFLHSSAIYMVNDKARAIATTNTAFEFVAFKNATGRRIASPLCFGISFLLEAGSTFFAIFYRWSFAASRAKSFFVSHVFLSAAHTGMLALVYFIASGAGWPAAL